jgi:Ca-activated chloride channel family protein
VDQLEAGGGTDLYSAVGLAFERLAGYGDKLDGGFPAIIVLSDGRSKDRRAHLAAVREQSDIGYDVPIFAIAFGDADDDQLEALAASSSARVFDGRRDLVKAFRAAKGYN